MQVREFLQGAPGLLWHSNDLDRLSLSGITQVLTTLCMVVVMKGDEEISQRTRCSCILAARGGKCSHMVIASFLHGHYSEYFDQLVEQTRKKPKPVQESLQALELRKTCMSGPQIPDFETWKQLIDVSIAASKKNKKRRRDDEDTDLMQRSPAREKEAKQDAEEVRNEILKKIGEQLASTQFQPKFSSLHTCINLTVTVDEAQKHKIGKIVFQIAKKGSSGPLRNLADKVLKNWYEEELAKRKEVKRKEESQKELKGQKEEATAADLYHLMFFHEFCDICMHCRQCSAPE